MTQTPEQLQASQVRAVRELLDLAELRDANERERWFCNHNTHIVRSDIVTLANNVRALYNLPRRQPLWRGGLTETEVGVELIER